MKPTFSDKLLAFTYAHLPWIAVSLWAVYFGYYLMPPRSTPGDFDYRGYGKLLVIDHGRYKPLDTVARTNLMILTHRQTYYDYDDNSGLFGFGKRYPATKWLLDVQTTPPPSDGTLCALLPKGDMNRPAWTHKVFRIENDALLAFLNLRVRDGLRYSIEEIVVGGKAGALFAEVRRVRQLDPKNLSLFDAKVHELVEHIEIYLRLSSHSAPLVVPDPKGEDAWQPFRDALDTYGDPLANNLPSGIDTETYGVYMTLLRLYDDNNPIRFNSVLAAHLQRQQELEPDKMRAINVEIFFNEFAPFYHCSVMYVVVAILGGLSWLIESWSRPLRKSAYVMMGLTFAVHLCGLFVRMYLQDRMFVFVTNLYSSAVFIGLGCVCVCLIVEFFYKNAIAIVVGSITGFGSLIIAHMLSLSGDTMEMMQAVLDTNFWLATHVTIITLGYTMAFVAGFMGLAYILLGIFTQRLRREGGADLTRMTYGVLCTGMFMSFVGTVLGGIWADQSWGRFWGWDPKENGALLVVIWVALVLHARWGGLVKHRGIAVLSVLGMIITSWSWFGTNFLGVGLHSYGFRQGAMMVLGLIDCVILAIAGLGAFTPLEMWQSFRPPPSSAEPTPKPK